MSDLIEREQALKALRGAEAITFAFGYHNVYEAIRRVPSAEPKTGKWVDIVEMDSGGYPFKVGVCCSACGFEALSEDNYCPCCGVKMSEIPTDSESEDKE